METDKITYGICMMILIIGVLVVLTNIIVEVLKKQTWEKIPTDVLAFIVAMVLTVAAYFAVACYLGWAIAWYYVAAAIVVGFMVAYAAMVGYDKLLNLVFGKLKEIWAHVQNVKT